MDLSTLVEYEQLYTLELRHPATDEPLGVTFQIRSAGSEKAKAVQRKHTDANLKLVLQRKGLTSARAEAEQLEKAASYIASWDWGAAKFEGETPELSMKTAMHVLDKAPWIFDKVVEAANTIENFTPTSAVPSVSG